jgi:polysaccharide transporter, PST family
MPDSQNELNTSHLSGDIGRRSVRGGAIMFAAQVVKVAIQIGSVIALARLLPPGAFGLIAMVAAISNVLDLVKELGLSTATIQREHLTQAQVSALFWINVAAGSLVAVSLAAAAPLVARFYGQPDLVAVTRWLALGFLLSGFTTQHWALLRRQMRFGSVAIIDGSSDIAGIVVAVILAVAGAGFWALVAQRLVPVACNLIGSWIVCRWRPSWPRITPVRDLILFGLSVTGCGILGALARSVDQILIGWMWGPTVLGLYERASKLLLVPLNNINIPLYSVALPALSRLADAENRYRAAVRGLYEKMTMVTMPAAALVAVTGDWLAPLLFGPSWHAAGPLVICFGAAAVTQPTIISVGLLYLPLNRSKELLRSTIIDAALCILLFGIGLPFGANGVAASFATGSLAIRLPISFWLATRRGPVTVRDLASAVTPSLVAAGVLAVAVMALRQALTPHTTEEYLLGYAAVIPVAIMTTIAVFLSFRQSREALAAIARLPHLMMQRSAAEEH